MQDLLKFLNVDPSTLPDQSVGHNVSALRLTLLLPLLSEVQERLEALFAPERKALVELPGQDLRDWEVQVLTAH